MPEQLHFGHMLIGSGTCTGWYTPFKTTPLSSYCCIIGFLIWLCTVFISSWVTSWNNSNGTPAPQPFLFTHLRNMFMCYICPPSIFHIPTIACLIVFKRFLVQIWAPSFCMFLIGHIKPTFTHPTAILLLQVAHLQSLFRKFKGSSHSFCTWKVKWMNGIPYQTI